MCGIIGYIGDRDATPTLAAGLKNLEYRGYDSVGIALVDDAVSVYKQTGTIDGLELPEDMDATCGIGHTRWSTHGAPTDENAHPHTDCSGQIAVVHNGIIENYEELKEGLIERGHIFESETDTEIVPHLIEEELDGDLLETVERVIDRLRGSFAISVVSAGVEEIVVARKGSPLVIGHGDDENFVGSDVTAFLERTREVTYLEDGDIARVTATDIDVQNGGNPIGRPVQTVEWEADAAEKGGYDHYMLKEIHEQPRSLRQTIAGRIDTMNARVNLDISIPHEYLQSIEEVQIVACGTSYHAGMYAAKLIEEYAGVRATTHVASEYEFTRGRDPLKTLVIAVTQSGETADTLSAIRKATHQGARTLAVTNTLGSTVTREVDDTIYIRAGPEISVAATKTFTSQVTTLSMLAVLTGRVRGALSSERASELLKEIRGLPGSVQQVLDDEPRVQEIAERYVDSDAFFYIGRKLGYPVALEGALKLKEISYDHAEGFQAGELKHGPLALVTERTPVFAILTEDTNANRTLSNVKEVESRSAPTIGVSSTAEFENYADDYLEVPELGAMEPLVSSVYLQLFAYYIADLKRENIDKPRNLAKSVTVE